MQIKLGSGVVQDHRYMLNFTLNKYSLEKKYITFSQRILRYNMYWMYLVLVDTTRMRYIRILKIR